MRMRARYRNPSLGLLPLGPGQPGGLQQPGTPPPSPQYSPPLTPSDPVDDPTAIELGRAEGSFWSSLSSEIIPGPEMSGGSGPVPGPELPRLGGELDGADSREPSLSGPATQVPDDLRTESSAQGQAGTQEEQREHPPSREPEARSSTQGRIDPEGMSRTASQTQHSQNQQDDQPGTVGSSDIPPSQGQQRRSRSPRAHARKRLLSYRWRVLIPLFIGMVS